MCNLGSVVLPKFVSEDGKSFDHQRLFEVCAYGQRSVFFFILECGSMPFDGEVVGSPVLLCDGFVSLT